MCRIRFRLSFEHYRSCDPLQLAVPERARHAPVVPCELPDGIRLVYADDRGRQRTVDLEDAGLVDFGLAKPLRKPPAYRGQRNFPGWWWSAATRAHVLYESWLEARFAPTTVRSPKSYVGIRRGRRVWAPLWFCQGGAYVYLPDPDGLRGEQQSPAMDEFQDRLRQEGIDASWQATYTAGANPIAIRLQRAYLDKPVVQELLRATFEILAPGATPWSERQAESPVDATGPVTNTTASAGGELQRRSDNEDRCLRKRHDG